MIKIFTYTVFFICCIFTQNSNANDSLRYHLVKEGETLYHIAKVNNANLDSIIKWNKIENLKYKVGTKLIIWKSEEKPESKVASEKISGVSIDTGKAKKILVIDSTKKLFLPFLSEKEIFSDNHLTLKDKFYRSFVTGSLLIKFLYFVMLFLLLSVFTLVIFISIRRYLETKSVKKEIYYKEKFRELIIQHLYDIKIYSVTEITKEFIDNKVREIFLSELLALHNDLLGDTAAKLRELYFKLGFREYSIKKLSNKSWHIKAKGLRELAEMGINKANETIKKITTDKKMELRAEANLAFVRLHQENNLDFLTELKTPLTLWDQINIYDTMTYHKISVPSFIKWLDSKNLDVIKFALRLIGFHGHTDAFDRVVSFLNHANEEIQLAAIDTLILLGEEDSLQHLKDLYFKESPALRQHIVKAVILIPNDKNNDFLEKVLRCETDNFLIRLQAARGLFQDGTKGIEILNELYIKADDTLKRIINHAKDTRI